MIPTFRNQHSSNSDECEMNIDHDTIPQNAKNREALSDTDTASFSSDDEMPSANASGCRPILWFHADSTFQPKQKGAVVNSWIAYCELKHRKIPLLDFIVPLSEALMSPGKLNAQYQRRRGTGLSSKTSQSLLNVGDHLPVTTKTQQRCRKCAQQKE
ncbi:rho guanine nucleotide exchange factor 10-like protein [Trichonephila clavipes]|uniref:Rho guanine nucleotide exchange factor 10-like protein n=1 Tax=Trichonephila clavipes TaxID=2585209 RepID=A0A8X6SI56_TRICX|nr:rho guanine nucleotide exchange factor 10-like protein [Trichonephila clavipes]